VLSATAIGAFNSLDRLLEEVRFGVLSRPASGSVVFADIDSATLAEIGVWPWPRELHAQLLDKLLAADAALVAFDVDFSARSTPAADAALARALEAAGGFAVLAAFEQGDVATGTLHLNEPIPEFAAQADSVLVNVFPRPDGLVDSIPASGRGMPSMALALSDMPTSAAQINVDFGIDLRTVDRISVRDILRGDVAPGRIAGRQVVVGASAIELRDTFLVPRYGVLPGPLLQIAGAETLKANRSLLRLGPWPGAVLAVLLALLWAVFVPRLRVGPAIGIAGALIGLAVAASFGMQAALAVTMQLGGAIVAVLALLALHLGFRQARELAGRRRAEARLIHLARHDAVTGLPSRLGLLERLGDQPGGPLLLVQLRRLDLARATLGAKVADAALRAIAARFSALQIGRVAALERNVFAFALPAGSTSELEQAAEQVREAVRPVLGVEGHTVYVDAVLGAAMPGSSATQLMHEAELALQAAAALPETVSLVAFSPEMEATMERRRKLDIALRMAVGRNELTVAFQPQMRTADGALAGAEALLRWTSPEFGPVSPAEFIPLAEENGLIVELGRFVLFEACRAAARWQWSGRMAVNVSAAQVRLTDLAEIVADALLETGFDPRRLDIEITESVLASGQAQLAKGLAEVRKLGVGVAIDDFGTGYSSLSYLSELEFDKLKIDQSFVRRLSAGTTDRAIVESTMALARRLGKITVAEGVETEEQRALLAAMGCDICQGWLFGKPVSATEFEERLSDDWRGGSADRQGRLAGDHIAADGGLGRLG
jgi:predicted signal transduction protein with EAL and GGDEF domain